MGLERLKIRAGEGEEMNRNDKALGWDYPAGLEHDPRAPWNQKDDVLECVSCGCEGGDGYSEMPFTCEPCKMKQHLEEKGCRPLGGKGIKACPLCGEAAIVWIDPKLSTLNPPTDFYSIGCVDVGSCGLEINGWLKKDAMIRHWNKRAK